MQAARSPGHPGRCGQGYPRCPHSTALRGNPLSYSPVAAPLLSRMHSSTYSSVQNLTSSSLPLNSILIPRSSVKVSNCSLSARPFLGASGIRPFPVPYLGPVLAALVRFFPLPGIPVKVPPVCVLQVTGEPQREHFSRERSVSGITCLLWWI